MVFDDLGCVLHGVFIVLKDLDGMLVCFSVNVVSILNALLSLGYPDRCLVVCSPLTCPSQLALLIRVVAGLHWVLLCQEVPGRSWVDRLRIDSGRWVGASFLRLEVSL